jgi:hypothetical protein
MHEESIQFVFREEARRSAIEPVCRTVLEHFSLPSESVCCIFDDAERWEFANQFGANFCGFFYPLGRYGMRAVNWPCEIASHLSGLAQGKVFKSQAVIYLRKATCDRNCGTAITFAHELEHLVQYGHHFKEWRANAWVEQVALPQMVNPKAWDFPTEHDAQHVSKRVAEHVLGTNEVERYTTERIQSGDDPTKWEFFRTLNVSEDYDFVGETRSLVERYRIELAALYRAQLPGKSEPDFTKDAWWE